MRKLKKGDEIRIKPNLHVGKYGVNSVVDTMLKYAGKIATIEDTYEVERVVDGKGMVRAQEFTIDLDDSYYAWTIEMFVIEVSDDELFTTIEQIVGISKNELLLDYESSKSEKPTEEQLAEYARTKFKDFL